MSSKRTRNDADEYPSKKRHVGANNENVDTINTDSLVDTTQQSQQIALQRSVLQRANLKSGKIKKIHLRNFMCHANFEVELNTSVNVIVGLNGSGKSAILTAIAIGLGSKASSTSRSTNLKDLVKQGEASATIEITLTNDGLDSFEEDVYGEEITVVRTINANSGASTYKLKNESGKVICQGRSDLQKLTMCLNIQVENPVLILNQDAARSFLKECDPKKLYSLFLKATQIETIIDKLHACLKTATSSKAQLEHLDRNIGHNEAEILVIKERHEKLQSVARLRQEITNLQNEMCWLKVGEAEKKRNEVQELFTKTQKEVEKVEDFLKNKGKYDKQLKEKIRDLGTEFTNLNEVMRDKVRCADEARDQFEKQKDVLSSVESAHRGLVDKLKVVEQNVIQLQADIDEREKNPLNVGNMRKENEQKIQVLQKKMEDLKLIMQNAQRDHSQFSDTLSDSRETCENAKKGFQRVQSSAEGCEAQIRQLQGTKQDKLSAYGYSMSKLVNRIEEMSRKGRFTEMPRGPLGRYIEVPDKKFKICVENILEGSLKSFLVSCDKDRILLTQILKEFPDLASTPIITAAFHHQVYDVRNGVARLNGRAGRILMDVIKVSDPVVMNCLIDQKKIESIVLVENIDDAIELTQNTEDVPQNLFKVILMRPLSEYYPAPNYRTYAMREKPARFIQTNNKELIASIQQQQRGYEEKLGQIKIVLQKAEADIREKTMLVEEKKKLIAELRQKDREYQQQVEEINSIEYPPEDEIEYLRQELENLQKRQTSFERKVLECRKKFDEESVICNKLENKTKESRDDVRGDREKLIKLQTEIENTQQQLRNMNNDLTLKANQLKDLKVLESGAKVNLETAQAAVDALLSKCLAQRVTPNQPEQGIIVNIKIIETRIKKIEDSNDNIDDVKLLLENKIQQQEQMKQIRIALDLVLEKLKAVRQARFYYIKRLRQHMSIRCKHKFNVMMGLRDYSAEVEIDHAEKTLELKVIPRDAKMVNAVSNTKSLSGGERSYSTVAFLIALWSCVEHPFYMLDEYDVFSDEHNRHMMTMLLFNEAEKKKDKQYCFLTPQDFSNIKASETITIHKLQDPERRN